MSKGYVYVLTNDAMPGLVKVGRTTRDPESRACELFQTGVPVPFEVYFSALFPDCIDAEAHVHRELTLSRVSEGREFFRVEPDRAEQAVCNAHREQLEHWLEEFLPDHSIENPDYCFGEGAIHGLAYEAGVSVLDLIGALHKMAPAEIKPVVERVNEARGKTRGEVIPLAHSAPDDAEGVQ